MEFESETRTASPHPPSHSPETSEFAARFSERYEKCITEILVAVQGLTQKMPPQQPLLPPGASSAAASPALSDTTDVSTHQAPGGAEAETAAEEYVEGSFEEWQKAISDPMEALHVARVQAAVQSAISVAVRDKIPQKTMVFESKPAHSLFLFILMPSSL